MDTPQFEKSEMGCFLLLKQKITILGQQYHYRTGCSMEIKCQLRYKTDSLYKCCFHVLLNNKVVARCQTERGSEFLPNPCSSSWHQPCEHSQEVDRAHGVQATPRNHSIRTVVPSLSPRLAPTTHEARVSLPPSAECPACVAIHL